MARTACARHSRILKYGCLFILLAFVTFALFFRKNQIDYIDICSVPFAHGEMCPKTYRELGGVCERNSDGTLDCPDIRRKANTSLRQAQFVLTRMLRSFDLVAKKHGIRYWLHSGTLIGAARHNASLPWEHDGDIEMPLEDYIRFFTKQLYKELPDDIFFQNSRTDPYQRPARGIGYFWQNSEAIIEDHHKVGHYKRPYNPRLRDKRSCYKYCLEFGCKWHDGLMVDIFILDSDSTAEFPLQEMTYEGFRFPVSRNWLQKLEDEFGPGIMQLPPKRERTPKAWPDPLHSCDELSPAFYKNRTLGSLLNILLALCCFATLVTVFKLLKHRARFFRASDRTIAA